MLLLIVEDEKALNASLVSYLQQGGYTCHAALSIKEAASAVQPFQSSGYL